MSRFKIPPISPLLGARPRHFRTIVRSGKVARRLRYKVTNTRMLVSLSSLFQWMDPLYFRKRLRQMDAPPPPLFIIGHWRSGTTLMHTLLSKDPRFGYVSTFHSVFPNNLRVKKLYVFFIKPFLPIERPGDGVHINMETPQEDEYSISNVSPLSFYHFFYFPSQNLDLFQTSVMFEGVPDVEKEKWKNQYREITLKSLLNTRGQRALIKNPVHTGRLPVLQEIYPEAQYIFLVRNPVKVYLSTVNFMSELWQTTALEEFTLDQVKQIVLENYQNFLQRYLDTRHLIDQDRLMEIRFEDLRSNPVDTLSRVYEQFSLGDFASLKSRYSSSAQNEKQHRMNTYSIDEAELNHVLKTLDFAMKHWDYKVPEDLYIKNTRPGKTA